jgi:hypothetical protein
MGFMMRRAPAAIPSFTLSLAQDEDLEPADEDAVTPDTTKRHA